MKPVDLPPSVGFTLYRAMSRTEFELWEQTGLVAAGKHWTGHRTGGVGFRILNRILRWVETGVGPTGDRYDLVVTIDTDLARFSMGVEDGTYRNEEPIAFSELSVYRRRVGQQQETASGS